MLVATMIGELIDAIQSLLDWLDALPPGRQAIATTVVGSAIVSGVGAVWIVSIWVARRVGKWRAGKAAAANEARERAAAAPKKLGFSEMLVAEDEALADLQRLVPKLLAIVSNGVAREKEIKNRMQALPAKWNPKHPQARKQFNQLFVDLARHLRQTSAQLRKETPKLENAAEVLRECQQRHLDWNQQRNDPKPPQKWIDGYNTFVSFRETVRGGASMRGTESRYDQQVRDMHRDVDAGVRELSAAFNQLADGFEKLEAMTTVVIDAVDRWRNRSRFTHLLESVRQKIASVRQRTKT